LPAYLQRKRESGQRVIPMGSTWFNEDRAGDELLLSPEPNGRGTRTSNDDDYAEYVPLSANGFQQPQPAGSRLIAKQSSQNCRI